MTVGLPPLLPAAAHRPRGGLCMPGRESAGALVSALWWPWEERSPLALLVVLQAGSAPLLLLSGLLGGVGEVLEVDLAGRAGSAGSWHPD